jgi:hypothetical protein
MSAKISSYDTLLQHALLRIFLDVRLIRRLLIVAFIAIRLTGCTRLFCWKENAKKMEKKCGK